MRDSRATTSTLAFAFFRDVWVKSSAVLLASAASSGAMAGSDSSRVSMDGGIRAAIVVAWVVTTTISLALRAMRASHDHCDKDEYKCRR